MTMLVQIMLEGNRDPELCRKIGHCVQRATDAALGSADGNIVRIVTAGVLDLRIAPPQSAHRDAALNNVAVAILMYPRSKLSERTKRLLFGRIGEALEGNFQISRRELVVGIIDTPARSWTFGYDQTELALATEGQLP